MAAPIIIAPNRWCYPRKHLSSVAQGSPLRVLPVFLDTSGAVWGVAPSCFGATFPGQVNGGGRVWRAVAFFSPNSAIRPCGHSDSPNCLQQVGLSVFSPIYQRSTYMSVYGLSPRVSIIGWALEDAVLVAQTLQDAGYLFVELRELGCEMERYFVLASHPVEPSVRLHCVWPADVRDFLFRSIPISAVVA